MNIVEIIISVGMASYLIYGIYVLHLTKKDYSKVNLNDLDLIPSMFTTIGILGTFGGIAYGLWFFNDKDISNSIPLLLKGLKTAFFASIFGVSLSIFFSKRISYIKNKNEKGVLSDETIAINKLLVAIQELRNDFSTTDDNGNKIKVGNVFRDIYKESSKQSNALQTFSSDLALTISAGFEEILNNPTQGVVAELKLVKAEIESLGNKLQDPATDMTQNIVKELQESMGKMIEEFKTSMSGDTKNEMEHLAKILGQAGGSLSDFPVKLQNMTDNLNENFKGLQDVVKQISQQTLSQSEDSTNAMKKQVEEMSEILKSKVGDLQTGQQSLLTEQSKNLQVSENLLSAFNTSIENMNGLSIGVAQSINNLNEAQLALTDTISNFRNASQEINSSSSKFGESQLLFSKHSNEFLQNNSSTIDEIQKSLVKAKDVSADYAQKFEIIEKGLQEIFAKITVGLKDYQETVSGSLETYLGKYTEALTKTAESLAGASSKQEDILEELTEQLSKLNARRI
jgi:methyl-accepting chemotaxis protein